MKEDKTYINWYPGHMAKTKREIKEMLDLIDIVYEVIDARMPISSKIVDIDELINNKPRLLIVTKYDLCDKLETDKILEEYKKEGYQVIKVDLVNNTNDHKIIIDKTLEIATSINNKRKEKGLKERKLRVLVVGVPNAGKSTLINRLVGKKVTQVGDRAGVTKNLGWIRINDKIELLDSPGILWPKLENQEHAHNLACLSSIKEEILDSGELSYYILKIMNELYPDNLYNRYEIDPIDFENIDETYEQIARKRGAIQKGGIPDYEKIYNIIIRDLKEGYLGKVTFDRVK